MKALGKLAQAYQQGRTEAALLRQAEFDRWILSRPEGAPAFQTEALAYEAFLQHQNDLKRTRYQQWDAAHKARLESPEAVAERKKYCRSARFVVAFLLLLAGGLTVLCDQLDAHKRAAAVAAAANHAAAVAAATNPITKMVTLVNPATGETYENVPAAKEAEAEKQFGLVTPTEYAAQHR